MYQPVLAPEGLYICATALTTLQISGAPVMGPQFKYSYVQKTAITATQNALQHKILQLMSEIQWGLVSRQGYVLGYLVVNQIVLK